MIAAGKTFLKRHWPALRLRTILLVVMLFAAAMPAIEAVWFRGYENTLVRQTEAELVVQGAALGATAEALWPVSSHVPPTVSRPAPDYGPPEQSRIDLGTTPILAERPAAARSVAVSDPDAVAMAARMDPIFATTTRDTLASIVLLDGQGIVVHGPDQGDLSALPEVKDALAGQPRTILRRRGNYRPNHTFEWLSRASDLRVHHARPIVAGGRVVGVLLLSRSPRALFRDFYEGLWKIGLGGCGIIILLVALSGLVSRGVTRPVEALSAATREVAAGRGAIPDTPVTAAVEIRALYEDFRSMSGAIARRSRYLRDFAAAVSHEFKTPLAGIAGAVELLQDHFEAMSADERNRFLANIGADTNRLAQLVARLLDLARADMARPDARVASDIGLSVRRVADALLVQGFQVKLDLDANLPKAAAPAATIEAVLSTLLENSRQAKASTGVIAACLDFGVLLVSVRDDGPGVPAADRDRLFEPFFTTRRASGGAGLGLAIARSLIEGHGGRLVLIDTSAGARFEFSLPIAIGEAALDVVELHGI